MESSLKTSPKSLPQRSKSQKPDLSMDSRSWLRTYTLRCIHCWSTHTSKTNRKKITSSMQSKMFRSSKRRLSGLWNGSTMTTSSLKGSLPLQPSKVSSSLALSALFSGWKREDWCLDSVFQMSSSLEMKVSTPTLPVSCTSTSLTSYQTKGSWRSSLRLSPSKKNSSQRLYPVSSSVWMQK